MPETKPSQAAVRPETKDTVAMEPPPAWAIALSEKVNDGFRAVRADVALVANDVTILRDRVVVIERWKLDVEDRQAKHSGGLTRESQVNEEQNAVIAKVLNRIEAIEANQETAAKERADTAAKVDAIYDSVVGVIKNPKVKFVGRVLFGIAMAYAAAKGIKVLP